jgi:hypothetical protein
MTYLRSILKWAGWGLLGVFLLGTGVVGLSFIVPSWFRPRFKTTELRAPSGSVYKIMERGPIQGIEAGSKTLGVQYLADKLDDAAALSGAADELEALVRPETQGLGYGSLVVMAYAVVEQKGLMAVSRTVDVVFQSASREEWDIFSSTQALLSGKEAASSRELTAAYQTLDEAVREKDARAIWDMETADYTDKLIEGDSMTKEQDMTYMQKQFAQLSKVSAFKVNIESLVLEGKKAVVTVKSGFSGVVNDEHRRDEIYYSDGWSRDIWKKTAAGWRISASEDLASKSFFFKP